MGKYDFDGYLDMPGWLSQEAPENYTLPLTAAQQEEIPAAFDLRDKNAASPCKDKGMTPEGIGICWLFSAIASMESHLLYKGMASQEDEEYIQSELYGAYTTFDNSEGAIACENPRGRKPGVKDNGLPAYGGHRYMAVNHLTRDHGTTPQALDPYYKADMEGQILKKRKWDITEGKPGKYYVKEVRYLPDPIPSGGDSGYRLQVKYHVMQYGGVACSIFWKNDCINQPAPGEFSYFDNTSGNSRNHAVTIMGWDDAYGVDKFKTPPREPGAFLVKNCWASRDAGTYFWISYESANFGMDAYCVTKVAKDFYSHPYKVYQHDNYGYNDIWLPFSEGDSKEAKARNVFAAASGDILSGISFYACSACYVTLSCSEQKKVLVEKFPCPAPGYYTCDLTQPVAITNTTFSIEAEYRSATNLPAYIPLEIDDEPGIYNHWNVNTGQSFVWLNGQWKDVKDLDQPPDVYADAYGNFCLKAIMENNSADAGKRKAAYDALTTPDIYDGYTGIFPEAISGESLQWRLEPYQASSYSVSYQSPVEQFTVSADGKSRYGLVNTGTSGEKAFLVATIGSGDSCMRKIFELTLGSVGGEQAFTCGNVKEHDNRCTVSGTFSIPGALVTAEANDRIGGATVQADGSWTIADFELYDASKGWQDSYSQTQVSVKIKSGNDLLLAAGKNTVSLTQPAEKKEDGSWWIWTVAGLAAALAAGGYAIYMKCKTMRCPPGYEPLSGGENVRFYGAPTEVYFEGEDQSFSVDQVESVENVEAAYRRPAGKDFSIVSLNAAKSRGGLVNKITKGGSVINCKVSGYLSGTSQIGGLFYEGEDVTVKNCTVDLEVENCSESYAGVAVNLSGSANDISGVVVKGKAKAGRIFGLVENLAGGTVQDVGVSLEAQAENSVSGLLGNGDLVSVSRAVVSGNYQAGTGISAGMMLNMKGGKISDSRISAVLTGVAGAYGIAAQMQQEAQIENCYSACRLTASGANAAVCGIAEGIEGISDSIRACVSVGSHFSGARAARISLQPVKNGIAYDGITCDGSFTGAGEIVKPAASFLEQSLYQKLGWDFSVWEINADDCFPLIQNAKIQQAYDYPFLFPKPPESGKFEYQVGQVVAILGAKHERVERLTWSLSPHLEAKEMQSGEFLVKETGFYVQIAALPEAGEYDLALISVLDGHKYSMPLLLTIR